MLLLWDDLLTNGSGQGVFTAELQNPHRFVIEYRTGFVSGGGTANFEVIFTEGSDDVHVVYGAVAQAGANATEGVQATGTGPFTQFGCNQASVTPNTDLALHPQRRAATATATATATSTAATSASTATASTAAAATTAATSATTATASDPLPCPACPRTAPRSREDEDPASALLGRQHPPRPLPALAARPCRLAEPEAGHDQASELPGQARRRPQLALVPVTGHPRAADVC